MLFLSPGGADLTKLYEFSYTDNQGIAPEDINRAVAEILEQEAEAQGWQPEFTFQQDRAPEQLADGRMRYYFEVLGEFEESSGNSDGSKYSEGSKGESRDDHVASEAGL